MVVAFCIERPAMLRRKLQDMLAAAGRRTEGAQQAFHDESLVTAGFAFAEQEFIAAQGFGGGEGFDSIDVPVAEIGMRAQV